MKDLINIKNIPDLIYKESETDKYIKSMSDLNKWNDIKNIQFNL